MPMFANIQAAFKTLNDSRVQYIVLAGFDSIPHKIPEEIVFLTPNPDHLCHLMGFIRLNGNQYVLELGSEEAVKTVGIRILQKGVGFYPERYESAMLSTTTLHANLVRIASANLRACATLYWKLFREDWLKEDPEARKALVSYVEDVVGPATPMLSHNLQPKRMKQPA